MCIASNLTLVAHKTWPVALPVWNIDQNPDEGADHPGSPATPATPPNTQQPPVSSPSATYVATYKSLHGTHRATHAVTLVRGTKLPGDINGFCTHSTTSVRQRYNAATPVRRPVSCVGSLIMLMMPPCSHLLKCEFIISPSVYLHCYKNIYIYIYFWKGRFLPHSRSHS